VLSKLQNFGTFLKKQSDIRTTQDSPSWAEERDMQAFSTTVRDLYALAEYASPDQFLERAISLLQMWIRFDGAIFGTGERSNPQSVTRLISAESAPAATVPETVLAREPLQDDPVARGIRNAPMSPSRGGIRELYRKKRGSKKEHQVTRSGPRSMMEELGLCHLIFHGDDPKKVQPARWIVLYRQQDVRFAETDAACLHGLWIHLSHALAINRARTLERIAKPVTHRDNLSASGLVHTDGQVELADQRFFDLLEREWPELAPDFIPEDALQVLNEGKTFRGRQVEISWIRQAGAQLCRIRPIDAMEVLTPREFVVARRFAAGMSHKQIARELGVSHHTVRNQLAHLYRKLDLHNKASLAQYLAANQVST
jgi:DNA-binding CsgD family transcriptional regulator